MSEPTDVIFRIDRSGRDREVFALFPGLGEGLNRPHLCVAYAHCGQHHTADYQLCISRSRPAEPAEYASIKAELEQAGYTLRVVHRATAAHRKAREA